MGMEQRFNSYYEKNKSASTPGPGNYKLNDIVGVEGLKMSIGKEQRMKLESKY